DHVAAAGGAVVNVVGTIVDVGAVNHAHVVAGQGAHEIAARGRGGPVPAAVPAVVVAAVGVVAVVAVPEFVSADGNADADAERNMGIAAGPGGDHRNGAGQEQPRQRR